jgi:hypothetical protein
MKHIQIFENFSAVSEANPSVKYDKGFDKCPCVMKQGWLNLDLNKDGSIEIIAPDGLTGEKRYRPNGVLELWKTNPDGTSTIKKSKYKCDGDKVVDDWVQNPKTWRTYKDTPFVKELPGGRNEYDIIPWMTKDSPGQNYISKLQQHLIDTGYLKISKPTGNLGVMTKRAILQLASKQAGEETNNSRGIRRLFYDSIFKNNLR